jgi:hypothetical protein
LEVVAAAGVIQYCFDQRLSTQGATTMSELRISQSAGFAMGMSMMSMERML